MSRLARQACAPTLCCASLGTSAGHKRVLRPGDRQAPKYVHAPRQGEGRLIQRPVEMAAAATSQPEEKARKQRTRPHRARFKAMRLHGMTQHVFWGLALVIVMAGCGSSDAASDAKPNVDQACEHESECVGGSSCLARSRSMGALGCTAATQACSFVCTVDSDCASYGEGLKCQPGCNGLPNTCVVP